MLRIANVLLDGGSTEVHVPSTMVRPLEPLLGDLALGARGRLGADGDAAHQGVKDEQRRSARLSLASPLAGLSVAYRLI